MLSSRRASTDTTELGLAARSADLSIGTDAPAPRLFISADLDDSAEYDLLRVDGLAECWHPERQRMVPMVYCVWAPPYTGQTPWQPLECVSSLSIIEFMRRSALGCAWLEKMVKAELDEPAWIKDPPGERGLDEAITTYPGQPDYAQGSVPDRPEVPERVFTNSEVATADATVKRWARFSHQQTPTNTAGQVEQHFVRNRSNQSLVINNFGNLHLSLNSQMLEEGGITVGDNSVVHANRVTGDMHTGDTVIFYGSNNSYRPDLPPQ